MINRLLILVRTITTIIVVVFFLQDIAWAYQDSLQIDLKQNLDKIKDPFTDKYREKSSIEFPHGQGTNSAFGEGVEMRHVESDGMIAPFPKGILTIGKYYYSRAYEDETLLEDRMDSTNARKIRKCAAYFNIYGRELIKLSHKIWESNGGNSRKAKRLLRKGTEYVKHALALERATTVIEVDAPTYLLFSSVDKQGVLSYQLTHIGRSRRVIYISKKALDSFNIPPVWLMKIYHRLPGWMKSLLHHLGLFNRGDIMQLATILNHDIKEIDYLYLEKNRELAQTVEGVEKLLNEAHELALKQDPFKVMADIRKRVDKWSRENMYQAIRSEISKLEKQLKKLQSYIDVGKQKHVYIHKRALLIIRIAKLYKMLGDIKSAVKYCKIAIKHFIDLQLGDNALLPLKTQIEIVYLLSAQGMYEEAKEEYINLLKGHIGRSLDSKEKPHYENFMKYINKYLNATSEIMIRHAQESGKTKNEARAFSVITEMTLLTRKFIAGERKFVDLDKEPENRIKRIFSIEEVGALAENLRASINVNKLKAAYCVDDLKKIWRRQPSLIAPEIKRLIIEAESYITGSYPEFYQEKDGQAVRGSKMNSDKSSLIVGRHEKGVFKKMVRLLKKFHSDEMGAIPLSTTTERDEMFIGESDPFFLTKKNKYRIKIPLFMSEVALKNRILYLEGSGDTQETGVVRIYAKQSSRKDRVEVMTDRYGVFVLPERYRNRLGEEVVLAGYGDHMALCKREVWENKIAEPYPREAREAWNNFIEPDDLHSVNGGTSAVEKRRTGFKEKEGAEETDIISAALSLGAAMASVMPQIPDGIAPDIVRNKALILYADDVLERGAAADLAYMLKETPILDSTAIALYERLPGRAEMLEKIIKLSSANKNIKVIKISPDDLKDMNGGNEISMECPDEAGELELLLRHVSSRYHVSSGRLIGVIKGVTSNDYIEGVRSVAKDRHVPVVSFEHLEGKDTDKEIYSFREAMVLLDAVIKDLTPLKDREWLRLLKPVSKKDIERAYQDYRRALEVAINA